MRGTPVVNCDAYKTTEEYIDSVVIETAAGAALGLECGGVVATGVFPGASADRAPPKKTK
jgi:hypothetical protein